MIPLDQEPLKQEALRGCRRTMKRLETARAQWERYEQEDRPAFERWFRDRFGDRVSELRKEEALVREYRELVEEVRFERHYRGDSYRMAYRRVMAERERRKKEETGEPDAEDDPGTDEAGEAFKSFFRHVFGCDDEEAEEMFREFTERGDNPRRHASGARTPPPAPGNAATTSRLTRVKDRFRLLARKLHPDLQTGACGRKRELWHEAQEAYREEDLERLDTLLAVCEVEEGAVTEATGLSLIERVRARFRESLRALNRKLREARQDPAWRFSRANETGTLESRLSGDLESALRQARSERGELEAQIAEWKKPAGLARTAKSRRPKRTTRAAAAGQMEFTFG